MTKTLSIIGSLIVLVAAAFGVESYVAKQSDHLALASEVRCVKLWNRLQWLQNREDRLLRMGRRTIEEERMLRRTQQEIRRVSQTYSHRCTK